MTRLARRPRRCFGLCGKQCSPFTQTDNKLKCSRTRILLSKPIPPWMGTGQGVTCKHTKILQIQHGLEFGSDAYLTGLGLSRGSNSSLGLKDSHEGCGKGNVWTRLFPAPRLSSEKSSHVLRLGFKSEINHFFCLTLSKSLWFFAIKSCLQWTFSHCQ